MLWPEQNCTDGSAELDDCTGNAQRLKVGEEPRLPLAMEALRMARTCAV